MKFLSAFLVVACLFVANVAQAQTAAPMPTAELSAAELTTLEVKVKGVGCAMDLKTLSEKVTALEGVASCETIKRGAVTTFEVKHNAARVDAKTIYAAIEGTAGCSNPNDRPYKVKR